MVALGLHDLGAAIVCIDAWQAHQSLKAMKANKTDPHELKAISFALKPWALKIAKRRGLKKALVALLVDA